MNPSYYTTDINGSIIGWSDLSPYKKAFPDYRKFVLVIGKSADVVIKTNYDINDPLFGGSRAISVNHVGCEMSDAMFHSLVNNPNQYDYIVQVMDHMDRGHIQVYNNGVLMTVNDVSKYKLV